MDNRDVRLHLFPWFEDKTIGFFTGLIREISFFE